jgi:hypothetical protein
LNDSKEKKEFCFLVGELGGYHCGKEQERAKAAFWRFLFKRFLVDSVAFVRQLIWRFDVGGLTLMRISSTF